MELNAITTPRIRRRYADDSIIVYLDILIDEVNLAQLSHFGFSIKPFTDQNECIDFITHLQDQKVFCFIIDQLVENNILFLSHWPLVASIYVICTDKQFHKHWTKDYPKIRGASGDLLLLTEALKRHLQMVYRNATPVTILAPVTSSEPINNLNSMFMYCELLKETFLEMNYGEQAKCVLTDYCKCEYADNEATLRVIDEFDRDYAKYSPTWWYTRDSFVYRMLNKALRTHDLEVINKFGFFIKDLHHQLKNLHRTLSSGNFTVYRGQSMSIEELIKLKENVGGLISFNSFLSTSADEHVSRQFALSSLDDPSLKAIFYVINVNLALTSSLVGYLSRRLSYFYDEQEYLWDMNAIFRISEVREVENGVCQVNLTTTSENDSQLKQLTDYMRREIGILSGMQRLGYLMTEMGEWSKAKDIYETLLQEEEDPCIIQQLGFIAHQLGDLDEALRYYRHALSIFATLLSPNDPELATIYANVGCVLNDKGHLEDALEQFKRTLELQCSVEKPNKLHIARTYNNIATVHDKEGRQREALENMTNALRIFRRCLPSTHPEIAASLGNIGTFYYKNEQYSKAMSYYEKCLSIQEASLPSHHPDIIRTTGLMKQTFGQIKLSDKALKKVVSSYSEEHEEPSRFVQPFSGSVMASFYKLRSSCNSHTEQENKCSRYLAWGLVCLVLTTVVAKLYLSFGPIPPGRPSTSVSLQPSNSTMSTSVKNHGKLFIKLI
ncbi:unnamed protein product [Rotaria magnacalcarata]|uniref:Uncharacterized protein n=1 Tax=Rotaria magnacalcarata TaxID=392030 RepID=A0A816U3U2_9BILA|nr:unnamed protein product [Rotaria magnacalcarata]